MNQVFDFEELSETITSTTLKVSNSDAAWIIITENNKIDRDSTEEQDKYVEKGNLLNVLDVLGEK